MKRVMSTPNELQPPGDGDGAGDGDAISLNIAGYVISRAYSFSVTLVLWVFLSYLPILRLETYLCTHMYAA